MVHIIKRMRKLREVSPAIRYPQIDARAMLTVLVEGTHSLRTHLREQSTMAHWELD